MLKYIWFIILFLLVSVSSLKLKAQDSIPHEIMLERIRCVENMLNKSKSGVYGWWYGWMCGYSAATVAQGAVYFISNDKVTRQDMVLGGVTTLLGAGLQILTPLNTGKDAKLLSEFPENTRDDLVEKLRIAEEMLRSNAMKEKAGRSWQVHALNEAVNLGSGLITWLGFKRSIWDGVGNFLLNSVITETQIWTQPTRTSKDYERYLQKYESDANPQSTEFHTEYFLRTYPGGISLSIVF